MLLASSDGVQAESFHIFQDDKFIPSLKTRELANDTNSSSAREYHAGTCAKVPFMWESRPGTPKHRLCQTSLPPLTPPPSFYSNSATTPFPLSKKKTETRKFVFPKFSFGRSLHTIRLSTSSETSPQSLPSTPSSWPSSSPAVVSSPVTPLCDYYYCRRYGFQFEAEEEKKYLTSSSPYRCSPFMCFGSHKCSRRNNANRSSGRCSSMFKRLIGMSTLQQCMH